MSSDAIKTAFAIMRAAADGKVTPGVGEGMSEVVCGNHKYYKFAPAANHQGKFTLRFTGNRAVRSLPPEEND